MESIISLAGDLILPYMILSVFTMLIVEILSRLLRLREKILSRFLSNMFGEENGEASAKRLLAHPLLKSLSLRKDRPAYLSSRLFALAFRDQFMERNEAGPGAALPTLENADLTTELRALLAGTPPDREVDALQRWFVEVMDQAAAVYRVRTFTMIAAVAMTIVLGLNFDARRISTHAVHKALVQKAFETEVQSVTKIQVAETSVSHPSDASPSAPMRSPSIAELRSMESQVEEAAAQQLVFPIGWSGDSWSPTASSTPLLPWLMLKIAGLGTSILAVMLGAPLLFDTLNKYMVIRLAIKPFESGPAGT